MIKRLTIRALAGLLTFFIGISVTTFKVALRRPPTARTAWQILVSFENQDLGELKGRPAANLQQAIDAVTGKPEPTPFPLIPRLLKRISNAKSQACYILVEESELYSIPGESRLRIHVFDQNGNVLAATDFLAGNRTFLTGVRIEYAQEIGREALVVSGEYVFTGRKSRQYYALVGDQIVLIRLEDENGQATQNDYFYSHLAIGPRMSLRSVEELRKELNSNDTAEVLGALTWLGGRHMNPRKPEDFDEKLIEAQLFDEARSSVEVQNTLRRLAESGNHWVEPIAEFALTAEYVR